MLPRQGVNKNIPRQGLLSISSFCASHKSLPHSRMRSAYHRMKQVENPYCPVSSLLSNVDLSGLFAPLRIFWARGNPVSPFFHSLLFRHPHLMFLRPFFLNGRENFFSAFAYILYDPHIIQYFGCHTETARTAYAKKPSEDGEFFRPFCFQLSLREIFVQIFTYSCPFSTGICIQNSLASAR